MILGFFFLQTPPLPQRGADRCQILIRRVDMMGLLGPKIWARWYRRARRAYEIYVGPPPENRGRGGRIADRSTDSDSGHILDLASLGLDAIDPSDRSIR